ncbi:MAG: AAA family ATPase [Chelatococcus sp.]|uniref:KAP family P-loop NTPase fold protein n=1 Tax=Chelatococcus sp. TaxID=1953771 RepID=UPI0025C70905|nr:P-loop NTPase fold protein [Chelatococcus sp.]MBX3536412.1 AAA family ATPase [Chelatococcus sp.]
MGDFVLGDDQPKENPWRDDKLGYAQLAHRIFNVITQNRAPNGYVLGLHGQWGSGKSTILNFIKAYLAKHNEETPEQRVELIEFQPWMVSGRQDLIVAFFKLLSETLGPERNRLQRGVRKLKFLTSDAADKLVDAAATVALTIDPTGTVGGVAGSVAKKSIGSFVDHFIKEKSLQQAYEDLRKRLRESGRRFVVTIDDIDRLDDDEVHSIMQMVKTIGRLPNVIYLLAYDRSIISKILDGQVGEGEPRFAEKIIQQEIHLPPPGLSALLKMLDSEISFLDGAIPQNSRWPSLLTSGLHRWIKRPRDVLLLSNAIKWAWPALEGNFDGADLLTMEGMRLFDPVAYAWIQANRNFLFNEGEFFIGNDEGRKANLAALKMALPEGSRGPTIKLLSLLFPDQSKWFEGGVVLYPESHVSAQNRRGMASKAHYDSYFALQLSGDAIPSAIVSQILSGTDADTVANVIRPYLSGQSSEGTERISVLFRDLRYRLDEKSTPSPNVAVLEGLWSVGEAVLSMPWSGIFATIPAGFEYTLLVNGIILKWGEGVADENLLKVARCSRSIGSIADLYVSIGRAKKVFGAPPSDLNFIKDQTFEELGGVLLTQIRVARDDDSLLYKENLGDILRAWTHCAGPGEPKSWILDNLGRDGRSFANIARSIMGEKLNSTNERSYNLYEEVDQDIFDMKFMIETANQLIESGSLAGNEVAIAHEIVRSGPRVLSRGGVAEAG